MIFGGLGTSSAELTIAIEQILNFSLSLSLSLCTRARDVHVHLHLCDCPNRASVFWGIC